MEARVSCDKSIKVPSAFKLRFHNDINLTSNYTYLPKFTRTIHEIAEPGVKAGVLHTFLCVEKTLFVLRRCYGNLRVNR